MCGISGVCSLSLTSIPDLSHRIQIMNTLLKHRGPDAEGAWAHPRHHIGLGHRRLSIIDLTTGDQPMRDSGGNWISYNGEIYNYLELREELGSKQFTTHSDTEVILHAYRKWGKDCLNRFRGMFSIILWDEQKQELFCARDRFGIKPLYYTVSEKVLYLASEVKALLPFVPSVETDLEGFKEYLAFQFCLNGKTLFKGIQELPPAHFLRVSNGTLVVKRYWQVYYDLDFEHTAAYFERQVRDLLTESICLHLRSDVPIGGYVSGGLDSSIIAALSSERYKEPFLGFTGKFPMGDEYDESKYARELARARGFKLHEMAIEPQHFIENIRKVIYHLDFPTAGPGSFAQYMVSQLASRHRKVLLGGIGGDEIFGGYARYLIAYFEQCLKAAINGTMSSGNFVVTYESIIPNLKMLKNYQPLLQEFWQDGLFDEMDKRYFRLINRSNFLGDEINWELLKDYSLFATFQELFKAKNVGKESYFDSMTHFDFKTLLPALLQVEDRVSMAHGIESRVPFLDHPLVELAATIPSDIKFKNGALKQVLRNAFRAFVPPAIVDRKDKMGFPVPLSEWTKSALKDFVHDIFASRQALGRTLINNKNVLKHLHEEPKFNRKLWGLLSLELWQQEFHDKEQHFKQLLKEKEPVR